MRFADLRSGSASIDLRIMYKSTKVHVAPRQEGRLKDAVSKQQPVSVQLLCRGEKGREKHALLLTPSQLKKVRVARGRGKRSITVRFSKRQVEANTNVKKGGLLPLLAMIPLIAKAVAPLALGAATGAVTGAVQKAVAGDGLFLKKGGQCVQIAPSAGGGLFLRPYHRHVPGMSGDGLFLRPHGYIY